jgi:hypothetical protein
MRLDAPHRAGRREVKDEKDRPVSRQRIVDGARLSARINGCLCVPDVKIVEYAPKVYGTELQHSDHCPLSLATKGAG